MNIDLRIQKGIYKGRSIPAPPRIAGQIHATPSLVKEAIFQLLANERAPKPFFDLCAGSGQMALEALSQGFHPVHLCEVDERRFRSLVDEVKRRQYDVILHKRDFRRAAPLILAEAQATVYLDPPYSFWKNEDCAAIHEFFEVFRKHAPGVPDREILLLIQGPAPFLLRPGDLPEGWRAESEVRKYRKTCVTVLWTRGPAVPAELPGNSE